MKTAENRHITDITMHTDPKTGYITGDFIFDGRTKKDQVGRFWTTLDMEGNHYIYWEVNVHGWYSRTWRRMKRCLLYTSPSPRDKRQSRMPSSA